MTGTGRTTRRTALASTHIRTAHSMKAIGSTISSTVKVRNIGQMVRSMKGNINMEKKTVLVNFYGPIARATLAISSTIIFMEKARIRGLMAVYTTATGKTIKCTAKAFLPGPMAENMKASTMTIKSKVMEFFIGQMDDNTMASGWQESSKVSASTSTQKARYATDVGKTVSA